MERETSLGKALRLLSSIGESADPAGISVSELLKVTRLSRPTAYRFLSELQSAGMVVADAKSPRWRLGPKVISLAAVAGNWSGLRRRARAAMETFVEEVGHTVHLGIRDGMEVVYIEKAESSHHVSISSAIGQRRPINVTALGKCLVAFDPSPMAAEAVFTAGMTKRTIHSVVAKGKWLQEIGQVRALGIAYDREECDLGARCVAAPIKDSQGYAVAAISLSALVGSQAGLNYDALAEKVRAMADRIAAGE